MQSEVSITPAPNYNSKDCYMIGYGDITEPPDYCERSTMTEDELNECTCCIQCCGCGG